MSRFKSAVAGTLDLTTLSSDDLRDLLVSLDEAGWELHHECAAYDPAEYEARSEPLSCASDRVQDELKRRRDAES